MATNNVESRNTDSPTADGGQDDRDDLDEETAIGLAREYLADELRAETDGASGSLATLIEATTSIRADIERGDVPDPSDLHLARDSLRHLEERLDDVARLHNISRWQAGRPYGELTECEKREIEEAEEADDGGE